MTQTPEPQAPDIQTPARRPGWLRWLLLVSLALNLLVAGVVVGHLFGDGPDRRVPRADQMGGPLTFALSKEDRREIGKSLRREYREGRPSRSQIAADYRSVIDTLRADPFDRARLEEVFARQLTSATSRIAIGQRLLLERIEGMDTADRRAFADRLEEGLERHKRRDEERERPER